MAKIITRTWSSRGPLGRRVRHTAFGYDARLNGKRERCWSADWQTEEEALDALKRRQKEIEAERISPRPGEATLGALAEQYLTFKRAKGKRSIREDERILKKRFLPAFGAALPARKLTAEMIAQYEARRTGQVSAFTIANELTVLRHMLRLGRKWSYLEQVPEIEMPKKPEPRERYLEETEIAALLRACRESRNPYLPAIVILALNTGMRKGELLGLEWDRVDLSTSRLTLRKTKSGKPRGIPINRAVYDVLTTLEPTEADRQGLVFARRNGEAWGQVRTAFTSALKMAKIKSFRFHDLRHTFASHYMMRGGSLYALKETLGHGDIKMTMRYAHLSPAHLRAGVDALDGLTGHIDGHISAKIGAERAVSVDAPVAQVDRATVS